MHSGSRPWPGSASEPQARRFVINVAVGFLPAVVLGLLFGKAIKAHLFTPVVVASAFIVGIHHPVGRAAPKRGRVARIEAWTT